MLVKVDFQNAFNTLSRQAIVDAVATQFPSLSRWVTWCYAEESDLYFGKTRLGSAAGVQQGDPLGPLLFAAALQATATELRAGPLDLAFFFLDDGVLAGDVAAVGAALGVLQARAAAIGLHLNLSKCEAVSTGASQETLSNHLPHDLLFAADGSSRVLQHFELLGAPVGDTAFVAAHTEAKV